MTNNRLVLGGGCFWCTQAIFLQVKGVTSVASAYSGGKRENPSYEQICTGVSGHAEVIDITYDSSIVSLENLLEIFFAIHNPTTLNAQGADRGTQYRSVIYYQNEHEQEIIEKSITEAQTNYSENIVTEVSPLGEVYKAEEYHQNYYNQHPHQGYCQVVIAPKLQKFISKFPEYQG